MATDGKRIGAVELNFRIVDALSERGVAGVTEVADALDIPKSTASVHLSTLDDEGYVRRTPEGYQLSLRFLRFGTVARERTVFEHARSEVEDVAEDLGEMVNLMVEEGGLGVYVYSVLGRNAVNLDTTPGRFVHLHTTALGKAMLSEMDDDRVAEIIDRHGLPAETDRTITDREALREELRDVRERGYAVDDEENLRGVFCVALPIVDGEEVHGAISVAGPKSRMADEEFLDRVCDRLRAAVNVVELDVAYG
jgi:DNA-binding IclR family transcriptional regulator